VKTVRMLVIVVMLLSLLPLAAGCSGGGGKSITAFVGSASKPAMEEAAAAFKEKTGIEVFLNFGGSGTMLSQMTIDKSGDLYIPGSPDYMAKAVSRGAVDHATVTRLAYLVPAIIVPEGNPAGIRSLADLARPGVSVGIGDPASVCVGLYAIEVMDDNGLLAAIGPNIVVHASSCSQTASLAAMRSVDAVIGWRVFGKWDPDTVDIVYLGTDELPRIAYVPGGISTYARDRESAQAFLDYLVSPEGQAIFAKWGYLATESDARVYAPDAQIGGDYQLPADYRGPGQQP
jgi:molybdate transport system substrate-binding protein